MATGSTVEDSIIFEGVRIQEHCKIKNAIILKGTVLLPKTHLCFETLTVVDNETLWKLGDQDA
jgi:ADP-glucose pyrophosphorylase